jgi:hypothetical protein
MESFKQIRRKYGSMLSNEQFCEVYSYTVTKSRSTGHDDSYVEMLLPDEISSFLFSLLCPHLIAMYAKQ